MSGDDVGADLRDIFVEIGEFGPQQVVILLLFTILNISSAATFTIYMVSTNTLHYRCKVPECEFDPNIRDLKYDQPWLHNAIPLKDGKLDSCQRYAPIITKSGQCSADMFNTSRKIPCDEYVYATDEKNIQTEFNIHCADNYKLALVGSLGNIARFIFLPITGFLCDKFGRLPMIIWNTQLGFIFASIKSFSTNYTFFLVCEFLEAVATTFVFTGIFVFFIELMSEKYHVLVNTIFSVTYTLGGVAVGVVAMYVHDFRVLMWIFYIPGLLIFVYIWLVPESVRWLLATGRIDRAIETLKRMAKFNRRELSAKTIDAIKFKYTTVDNRMDRQSVFRLLWMVLKSKKLCVRFFCCCFQWIACCFCYYGLTQSAIHIPNTNQYVSFIISMCVEIPCELLSQPLLNRMKRRTLMGGSLILTCVSIISTVFIPETYTLMAQICFMVGKGAISIVFTVVYLYTTEQWPTNIRNTIVNTCSMIGRIGSMVAPFIVILDTQYGSMSALLFAISSFIAAITIVFSPETFAKKLPDTIEEAEQL